jgi:broad specificity phosphatase PhoE
LSKIFLVRHGETTWNKEKRIQGSASDTPLSESGKGQAERVALKLQSENVQAIYSSPLQRALDTARTIAGYHNLEVRTDPGLVEISAGELEGILAADLKIRFDEYMLRFDYEKIPGGESLQDVQDRSWNTLTGLLNSHPDGSLVVVTHYFVVISLVCKVLNLPLKEMVHLRLSTGTLTVIVVENNFTRLELFNSPC